MPGQTIPLKCECGQVRGEIRDVTHSTGNHIVCYCNSCQAFARHLREDLLDEWGGTEIFQLPPAQVQITNGADQIRCLRLTAKGMHRWYTACCRTPIGNTMTPGWPFVGIARQFLDVEDLDATVGPIQGYSWVQHAAEGLPQTHKDKTLGALSLPKVLVQMIRWRMAGKHRPTPYFDDAGKPVSAPEVLG